MNSVETHSATVQGSADASHRRWFIADLAVLLTYAAVVLATIRYHEKWADEAQAWLLARDLDFRTLFLSELHYEGSPGLWHLILWIAQHVFHARYEFLSVIGAVCAIGGTAVLLFCTPFPRGIRWLMAFSYFFLYQYAVVARPYVLFALFALLVAKQFRDLKRPGWFALPLLLLSNLTAHGSIMAAVLGLIYAVRFITHWNEQDRPTRIRFVVATSVLALVFLFLFITLKPAPDTEAMHAESVTSVLILRRMAQGITGALVDNQPLSLLLFLLFAAWCYRRKALASFLLPVTIMAALYGYAAGWAHQQGTLLLAMIAGLAIAWPAQQECRQFAGRDLWAYRGIVVAMAAMLSYQVYVAGVIIQHEIRMPYCGADDAAQYLRPLMARGKVIYGYQYAMVAINAHFDQNIFANLHRAYFHHAVTEFDQKFLYDQIPTGRPDCVVLAWWEPWDDRKYVQTVKPMMDGFGYSLVHASNGYLLTKRGWPLRQIYLIFQKNPG